MVKVMAASLLLIAEQSKTGEFNYLKFEKVYDSLPLEQKQWLLNQWSDALNAELESVQSEIKKTPFNHSFWEKHNA